MTAGGAPEPAIIGKKESGMLKDVFSALARFAALVFLTQAALAASAEIKVLSTPTLKTSLEALAPQFELASGHKLVFKFEGVAPLKRQIEAGEPFDVAILLPAMIDDLTMQGKIAAGTRRDIARTAVGVAIQAGAPRPDVSTRYQYLSPMDWTDLHRNEHGHRASGLDVVGHPVLQRGVCSQSESFYRRVLHLIKMRAAITWSFCLVDSINERLHG
ncbi:hypothetical protein OR16_06744 [Cupriavidus basilensis OR16]|uniref:ABC transporter substrate-binding protein n=1 Tax=Cupriavidus basilensis OR16 TaxID=1127483 RepID=H1S0V7_9BURK|nr:substrate-binding domain-containing protein [Cupriavidus basilensis]EHP43773.1 hypothetical protein OR16_06744 [Cupriavidus basilensis OR16]